MRQDVKLVSLLLSLLLVFALLPLPYGYYTFLRLAVFGGGLFIAYQLYEKNLHSWSIFVVLPILLFNPVIPIYLSREVWLVLDLFTACLFSYIGFYIFERCNK